MARLNRTAREILRLLSTSPAKHLSYNDIAIQLYVDRSTVITAVRRLEREKLIIKNLGRGQIPNSYEVRHALVSTE